MASVGSYNRTSGLKNKIWDEMEYNEVTAGEITAMTKRNVANEVKMEYKKQK